MSTNQDRIKEQIFDLVSQHHSGGSGPASKAKRNVPVTAKLIDAREKQLMVEAALDGWLTTGRFNEEFEIGLARYIGIDRLITVNSGSSANLVAFSALTSRSLGSRAIKPGDEVITVAAGFPTTINPAIQFGAIPVFVDVDIGTYNIKVADIEACITEKTKAIILAHALGNPFDVYAVKRICDKYGLWLIEDCCDALGTKYDGRHVGTFGDLATLSFYPAHHITMGEGGAVFSNSSDLITICESFRDWGRDCYCKPGMDNTCGKRFCWKLGDLPNGYDHKYIYSHLGYNLKITDMQAACGLAQLEKLDYFVSRRRSNFERLFSGLNHLDDLLQLPIRQPLSDPSWFGFPVTVAPTAQFSRHDLVDYLNQQGIGTRYLFAGNVTRQPYMRDIMYKVPAPLVNSDIIMNNTFWVGCHPALTEGDIDHIIYSIRSFLGDFV